MGTLIRIGSHRQGPEQRPEQTLYSALIPRRIGSHGVTETRRVQLCATSRHPTRGQSGDRRPEQTLYSALIPRRIGSHGVTETRRVQLCATSRHPTRGQSGDRRPEQTLYSALIPRRIGSHGVTETRRVQLCATSRHPTRGQSVFPRLREPSGRIMMASRLPLARGATSREDRSKQSRNERWCFYSVIWPIVAWSCSGDCSPP